MQYSCIISHLLSPFQQRFHDIQIVVIMNFVIVIKCRYKEGWLYMKHLFKIIKMELKFNVSLTL